MIYKIVQGNSFLLHLILDKVTREWGVQYFEPYNLTQAESIRVGLRGGDCCCHIEELTCKINPKHNNEIECQIPKTLELGCYDVKVSWTIGGKARTSAIRNIFAIVGHDRQTKIPPGIFEGEATDFFNTRYYISTDYSSTCTISYALSNVTSDNTATEIDFGESYTTNLTADDGYMISNVTVMMNGSDVTSEVYQGGVVTIPSVVGDVVINATAIDMSSYLSKEDAKKTYLPLAGGTMDGDIQFRDDVGVEFLNADDNGLRITYSGITSIMEEDSEQGYHHTEKHINVPHKDGTILLDSDLERITEQEIDKFAPLGKDTGTLVITPLNGLLAQLNEIDVPDKGTYAIAIDAGHAVTLDLSEAMPESEVKRILGI